MAELNIAAVIRDLDRALGFTGVIAERSRRGQEADLTTLGGRVKFARERNGLKQQKVADAAGMSQQSICFIENGKTSRPRRLFELAQVLGVSQDWLLFGGKLEDGEDGE